MADKNIIDNSRWLQALAAFETYLIGSTRAPNTIQSYMSNLRIFGRFYVEELGKRGPFPSRLHENDLATFIKYLRSTKYAAASSINSFIASLKVFVRFMLEKKMHKRDIARELRTYRVALSKGYKGLSEQETRRLITGIDLNTRNGHRDLAIMQLFLQCGLRTAEIAGLIFDDITLYRTSGRVLIRDNKTHSSRAIPLNASIRSALKRYLDIRDNTKGSDPFFLSERGQRISVKTVQYIAKKYLCIAGRNDISADNLRHHFATNLYKKTGKLALVQSVLGHRQITTTARYIGFDEPGIQRELERLPDNIYHGQALELNE